jgi:hypothetical protein
MSRMRKKKPDQWNVVCIEDGTDLGHLDYITIDLNRYICGKYHDEITQRRFAELMEDVSVRMKRSKLFTKVFLIDGT